MYVLENVNKNIINYVIYYNKHKQKYVKYLCVGTTNG